MPFEDSTRQEKISKSVNTFVQYKKRLPFGMRTIGSWDPSKILSKISEMEDSMWYQERERKDLFAAHTYTNTLIFYWSLESLRSNVVGDRDESNCEFFSIDETLEQLRPIYKEFYGEGKFLRVMMTRLEPFQEIKEHTDGGLSLMLCRRTHLPLQQNAETVFHVDGTDYQHEIGKIYELNNAKVHAVRNGGPNPRINLIIDYMEHR